MSMTDDLRGSITKKVANRDLPGPLYAVFGAADAVRNEYGAVPGRLWNAATAIPQTVVGQVEERYALLVERGQERAIEIGTERAVRARVARVEKRVTPRAAKAAARLTKRRQKVTESKKYQATTTAATRARAAAKRSAARFSEMNAPVLLDPDLHDVDDV